MLQNNNIPLVRAAVMEPIFHAADSIGVPVEKIALSVGLPIAVFEQPEIMVPQIPAQRFVEKAARLTGDNLFGIRMAQPVPFHEIASVIPFISGCTNLNCVLKRFCATGYEQSTVNNYTLEECGDFVWLSEKGARITDAYKHVEMFELTGMIQLVQLAAGAQWRPPYIHFCQPYNTYIEKSSTFNPSQISYSQRYAAIAIERRLLSLATPTIADLMGSQIPPGAPIDLNEALLESIAPYIGEQKLNTKIISDITNMSFRTLQRKLMENGSSYSQVIDKARFRKAGTLLEETNVKLLDISLLLGYQNASSFTRAFKRLSGVTPKEYRKRIEENS